MRISRIYWLALVVVALSTFGIAVPLTIVNADFSAVPIICGGYSYQFFGGDCNSIPPQQDFNGTPGFGWTLIINSGIGLTAPNSAFQPPDFTGFPFQQALFLQDGACIAYQAIAGFSAGTNYVLSFYIGSRYWQSQFVDGNQTVQVSIDGTVIDTLAMTSFTPFSLKTVEFSVATSGAHTLAFDGIVPGDHTAFVSGVSIAAVPEPTTLLLIGSGVLLVGRKLLQK
jgi:PEP-CTERM motif